MAESLIVRLVEKLGTPVYQQISSVWGVKDELKKLQETLSSVKAVLLDAEEKQAQSHQLRDWLQKLTDACYDAEDVLDEFEVEVVRKQVLDQQSIGKKVRYLVSSSNPLAIRYKMARKTKEIRKRFDEIAAIKTKFHLSELYDNWRVVNRGREMTHSFVVASDVIGRDDHLEEIIKLIIDHSNDGQNLSVIPIVGIGGLGKTTLAKLAYNDDRIRNHFDSRMWICVSEDFGLKQLMMKIIKSVTGQNHGDLDTDELQKMLRETLNGKRYLLVMDDVWNEDCRSWIELKNILSQSGNGSVVLVTTRSDRVASIMGTMRDVNGYKLEGLSNESCLSLLLKCAFKEAQEKQHHNLIKIGEEIVTKCGGIPLAVTTLGSLLYSSTDEYDWTYVRDNEIWKLDQKKDDILPALRLSYDQLPSYLKQCFAYCCMFPKDYKFASFELIQFWMAHGLLQSSTKNQDLESVGRQYLKELASRSFFQDFEQPCGLYYAFKMHDLMHDLAMSLMKNECLILNSGDQCFTKRIRHLSLIDVDTHKINLPSFLSNLGQLRSISFAIEGKGTSQEFIESCISRFKFLRVIRLDKVGIDVLPKRIGDLRHLRYLDLRNNKIRKLPDSICKLQHLQSLSLLHCEELEELPKDISYLINLQLFFFTTKQRFLSKNGVGCLKSLRFLGIYGCANLEYLFEDIGYLKAFRSLYIVSCPNLISLPHGIKYLNSLETLIVDDCEKLNLDWSMGTKGEDNHQDLSIPRAHLRVLFIKKLPQLEELPQWLLQGSANTLQSLNIEYCSNFKALPESMQDLKSLQDVHILDCLKLSSLPKDFNCLIDLRELQIENCPKLSERCKPETGEDWPKIALIPKIELDGEIIKSTKN
ncbi:putative disease resistance protein RGA1 [Pistacia vera]|uniref:putative disease resistance protein RGA1 n=1 Tax=Pistacia vera TaxID=55513 RepID=UPI00126376BA|nr:putative disease resistance protein RGA1 [Pistacia vera]